MQRVTQNERILKHLEECGSITQLEALDEYGIMRLASRVSDLKRLGYDISREMVTKKNRYGDSVSFAKYKLVQ